MRCCLIIDAYLKTQYTYMYENIDNNDVKMIYNYIEIQLDIC